MNLTSFLNKIKTNFNIIKRMVFFILMIIPINKISCINTTPYPIQFSLSESKIVSEIPKKERDFAYIIPGDLKTYIYTEEIDYYKSYQSSYYAITRKKGGWDCLRHYEILANGCIPYFLDIDKCHPKTMSFLPKELIKEAMNLEGVSGENLTIDHSIFNETKYFEILDKLLQHMRNYLTSRAMAKYVLDTVDYTGPGTILYLSQKPKPDYMRCTLLIGLKEYLGTRIIDFPKVEHIYESYMGDTKKLYGKGFSYTKIIEDEPVDRNNIRQRIENREFDLIIYATIHRGLPFYETVLTHYSPEEIIYICGEDAHKCKFSHLPNLFIREYYAIQNQP